MNCSCSSKASKTRTLLTKVHFYIDTLHFLWLDFSLSSHWNATCTLFTVSCSCSSKGALAAITKDPGPLVEAITRGDLSTAKMLLGITESETESGDLTLVAINPLTWLYTSSVIQWHNFKNIFKKKNSSHQAIATIQK